MMNRNDDPVERGDLTPGEVERLADTERRLKSVRPRAIHWDSPRWERVFSASEFEVGRREEAEVYRLRGGPRPHGRRLSRMLIGAAAIWLFGAGLGASGMYWMMSHRGNVVTSADVLPDAKIHVASDRSEDPVDTRPQPPAPPVTGVIRQRNDAGLAASTKVFAFIQPDRITSWLDDSAWASGDAIYDPAPPRPSDRQRELVSTFVPPPGATPRRVLEGLIADGTTVGQPL